MLKVRRTFSLSPSSLTFLYQECPACFHRHVHGERRPSTPFPSVFRKLDIDQKAAWIGRSTRAIDSRLPRGVIASGSWIASAPIPVPGRDADVIFRGYTDATLQFDDGTTGIVDFKTVTPKDEHLRLYGRQLHAYAWALEHPGRPTGDPVTVTHLGLLAFPPEGMVQLDDDSWAYVTHPHWIPVTRDDEAFGKLLTEVVDLLTPADPPAPNPECSFCKWRAVA